tara:strand:+ start:174 stop:713 length:540 start_codon:yes stop_codon:yes gene_type:complete
MKKLLFILIIPFLSLGQNDSVFFEELINEDDCHMCPGILVVQKGNLSDTLLTGSWGKVNSNYTVHKIGDKDYVILRTSYFGMGILEEGIFIYSTEPNSFLKELFGELYITQADSYQEVQSGALKCTRIKRDIKFNFEENFLKVDIDTTLSFLIEPDEEFTIISSGTKQEKYILFNGSSK